MHVDSGLANQAGDFIVCLKNFCFLGQGLSLSLELTGSARLVGHWAPGSNCYLPRAVGTGAVTSPGLEEQLPGFLLQRVQTPVLMPALWAFYWLNYLLNFSMTVSLEPIKSSKGFLSVTVTPENTGACGHQVIWGLVFEDNWASLSRAWVSIFLPSPLFYSFITRGSDRARSWSRGIKLFASDNCPSYTHIILPPLRKIINSPVAQNPGPPFSEGGSILEDFEG